jgi:hypothetical protein
MHRGRGGRLASPLTPHPPTRSFVSRRFRSSLSASTLKNAPERTKQAWNKSALNLLTLAGSHRAGRVPPKKHRSTELTLVNSILDEHRLPTAAEKDFQDVARRMAPHLEEGTSELPPGVGPGALVEVRW